MDRGLTFFGLVGTVLFVLDLWLLRVFWCVVPHAWPVDSFVLSTGRFGRLLRVCGFRFSVHAMNPFAALVAGLTNPIDTLEHFDAQVLNAVGCSPARIREWTTVHKVYYGPTKFTRKQANAIKIARSTRKSMDQLVYIESRLSSIKDPAEKWVLRLALLSVPGDYKTLQRRSKDIVPEGDKPAPEPTVGFGRSREKSRPMNVMGPDKDMAAIEYALRQRVTGEGPAGPQMYEALMSILGLRPDAESEGDAAPSRIAPAIPPTTDPHPVRRAHHHPGR